ncbi:unnamed protein product [Ixodes hexagonus]
MNTTTAPVNSSEPETCVPSYGRWFGVAFRVAVVTVTASGAATNAATATALFWSPKTTTHGSKLLANVAAAALVLSVSTLAASSVQLMEMPVSHIECVIMGSTYTAAVLSTAISFVFLVTDQCIVVLYPASSRRKWTDPAFCVASWVLSWTLVLPAIIECWGSFRLNKLTEHCEVGGPQSVVVVHGFASVVLPVVCVSLAFTRLLFHVRSVREACLPSPRLVSSETPRFIQATCSKHSSEKLDKDLSSMLLVLVIVCTFYLGFLPHAVLGTFFADDVGCLATRLVFLWWLVFGSWGPFLNLVRSAKYRALCRQFWWARPPRAPTTGRDEFGM